MRGIQGAGYALLKRPPLHGWVNRALEGYPEQVENHDSQPSNHPADGADDDGKEVEGHLVGQEQVGQEQEDQPDDGVFLSGAGEERW